MCARRAEVGAKRAELRSQFSVGTSQERGPFSLCWCLFCERQGLGSGTASPWPLPGLLVNLGTGGKERRMLSASQDGRRVRKEKTGQEAERL